MPGFCMSSRDPKISPLRVQAFRPLSTVSSSVDSRMPHLWSLPHCHIPSELPIPSQLNTIFLALPTSSKRLETMSALFTTDKRFTHLSTGQTKEQMKAFMHHRESCASGTLKCAFPVWSLIAASSREVPTFRLSQSSDGVLGQDVVPTLTHHFLLPGHQVGWQRAGDYKDSRHPADVTLWHHLQHAHVLRGEKSPSGMTKQP